MTAMIIGGIGRLQGAALGGLIIGLTESIGIWKIPSQWQIGIAFTILFFVLIFKPTGLFGVRVYRGKI